MDDQTLVQQEKICLFFRDEAVARVIAVLPTFLLGFWVFRTEAENGDIAMEDGVQTLIKILAEWNAGYLRMNTLFFLGRMGSHLQ